MRRNWTSRVEKLLLPATHLRRAASAGPRLQTQVASLLSVCPMGLYLPAALVALSCCSLPSRSTVAQLHCNRSLGVFRSTLHYLQMVRSSCHRLTVELLELQHYETHFVQCLVLSACLCISADVELEDIAAMALQQSPGASSLSTPQ